MSPWYRLFFSTNSASSLCSGCASCSTPAGQALGPHTVRVHPSPPRHRPSAPASLHPLPVSPTSPSATPVNRPLSPVPPHPVPHHRASVLHRDAVARSTPLAISAPIPRRCFTYVGPLRGLVQTHTDS